MSSSPTLPSSSSHQRSTTMNVTAATPKRISMEEEPDDAPVAAGPVPAAKKAMIKKPASAPAKAAAPASTAAAPSPALSEQIIKQLRAQLKQETDFRKELEARWMRERDQIRQFVKHQTRLAVDSMLVANYTAQEYKSRFEQVKRRLEEVARKFIIKPCSMPHCDDHATVKLHPVTNSKDVTAHYVCGTHFSELLAHPVKGGIECPKCRAHVFPGQDLQFQNLEDARASWMPALADQDVVTPSNVGDGLFQADWEKLVRENDLLRSMLSRTSAFCYDSNGGSHGSRTTFDHVVYSGLDSVPDERHHLDADLLGNIWTRPSNLLGPRPAITLDTAVKGDEEKQVAKDDSEEEEVDI